MNDKRNYTIYDNLKMMGAETANRFKFTLSLRLIENKFAPYLGCYKTLGHVWIFNE